MGSIYN